MHLIYNKQNSDSTVVAVEGIGDIKQTTLPFESSKWHLADGGWVEGKIYAYVLRCEELYPGIFTCTNEEFESVLETYGQCGKYVIDSENQRIRLPKLDGFIEGTSDVQQLSTLKPAGLPNITGGWDGPSRCGRYVNAHGAYYGVGSDIYDYGSSSGSSAPTGLRFDASRSSPVYGRSQKVQPQAIIVLTYIRIQ